VRGYSGGGSASGGAGVTVRAIDLFAGWGGFTLGASLAGVSVVWAANHWPLAVSVHSANHPDTAHACQDLRQADWTTVPEYDLLLAAPACQGHSQASQPRRREYHDSLRATAWAVVDCAEATVPDALVVENVPRFRQWQLYRVWCDALRTLGYRLTEFIIDAADHGAPQHRQRLFVFGTRNGTMPHVQGSGARQPFGQHVEWEAAGWRSVASAAPGARERIGASVARLGSECLVQHVTGHRGVPLDGPIRTITTKDQWIVVRRGREYRPLTLREYARAMAFPDYYQWPGQLPRSAVVRGLGNAVCPPVGRAVVRAAVAAMGSKRIEAAS
jgi:DNA (cytosine-5)-methyltransferase 1